MANNKCEWRYFSDPKYCPYCGGKIVVIESETYVSSREEDLYSSQAKQGKTTIRPEFPVFYEEG